MGIPDIMDIGDLVELLRVSKQTVMKCIEDGKIPAYKIAKGKYLITKRQLIKTIEKRSGSVLSDI